MINPKLTSDEQKLLMLDGLKLRKRPTKEQEHYLKFHRGEFQRRTASA
jgi:hypothetical protein